MSARVSRVKTRDEVLVDIVRETPVDRQVGRIRRWLTVGIVLVVIALVAWSGWG